MTMPEFSRPESVEMIGATPREIMIEANPAECAALAARFDLIEITHLSASMTIIRDTAGIRASGRISGAVVQACTVTGDPVPAMVAEPFALLFVEEGEAGDGEIELCADALDSIPFSGGTIDLGEAAAETLALALDPFPKGPGAAAALRAAGVIGEGEAAPFGALAGLRDQLARRS